jgi:hypothetical protein
MTKCKMAFTYKKKGEDEEYLQIFSWKSDSEDLTLKICSNGIYILEN